jgi:hypothetical protein
MANTLESDFNNVALEELFQRLSAQLQSCRESTGSEQMSLRAKELDEMVCAWRSYMKGSPELKKAMRYISNLRACLKTAFLWHHNRKLTQELSVQSIYIAPLHWGCDTHLS